MKFKEASTKSKVEGFVAGCILFNALGFLAHTSWYVGDIYKPGEDYSLSHRFESAYCINADPAHKMFNARSLEPDVVEDSMEKYLFSSPYATWPVMLAFGALGAFAAAKNEEEPRYRSYLDRNQRTR